MIDIDFCPSCMASNDYHADYCPDCGKPMGISNNENQLPVMSILNGRFIVGKVLGEGGFGITYIGYDLKMNQRVAIKEFFVAGISKRTSSLTVTISRGDMVESVKKGQARFILEAQMLAQFDGDPRIVRVYDYFEENNTAYIVMEYLDGEDLRSYLKKHGPMSFGAAFKLLLPAMEGLCKVHEKGLIHRDISPANIMRMSDGQIKLLDFGTTRVQSPDGRDSLTVALKHGFAPLEQYASHGNQGAWTDVYAMCASLYQLITGKVPPPATNRRINDELIPPSQLHARLSAQQEAALLQGLAIDYRQRIQTMPQLIASLREGVVFEPPKPKPKTPKWLKPAVAVVAVAVVAVGVILGVSSKTDKTSPEETGKQSVSPAKPDSPAETEKPKLVKKHKQDMVLVKESFYAPDGTLERDIVYTHVPDTFIVESFTSTNYFNKEVLSKNITEFTYKETDTGYERTGRTSTSILTYSNQTITESVLLETRIVDGEEREYTLFEDGAVKEYSVEQIGENGEECTFTYNADDVLIKYSEFKRDGNTSVQNYYDGSGKLTSSYENTYNDDDKVQKRVATYYNDDGSISQTTETENSYTDGRKTSSEEVMTRGEPYGSIVEKTKSECKYELREGYYWDEE